MGAFVYILASRPRGALYIGVTTDIRRRLVEHRAGYVIHTRRYRIQRLVYLEERGRVTDAIIREKQLKKWMRARKIKLIETNNPNWADLIARLVRID